MYISPLEGNQHNQFIVIHSSLPHLKDDYTAGEAGKLKAVKLEARGWEVEGRKDGEAGKLKAEKRGVRSWESEGRKDGEAGKLKAEKLGRLGS